MNILPAIVDTGNDGMQRGLSLPSVVSLGAASPFLEQPLNHRQ